MRGSTFIPLHLSGVPLRLSQVQVSRNQNNSRSPWTRANIHVFHRHTPYVIFVPVFLPSITAVGGREENHRLSGQPIQ